MRSQNERNAPVDHDEPSGRRDERESTRSERARHDDERNRNARPPEPRLRPEQSQVGRGYGGNDGRYGHESYWDADERQYEWGVRSPEDHSHFVRGRDRYDRFSNTPGYDTQSNQRHPQQNSQYGAPSSSVNRHPSGAYAAAHEHSSARRPRDAWDDDRYGRDAAAWGSTSWDRGESSARNYGSSREDTSPGRSLGGHAGKGPKGYVRSDERIREDVCDGLSVDDEIDASDITVTVKSGEVTLEGSVIDRHSKHRAEDIADSVSGVREVNNRLRARKGFIAELGDKLKGDDDKEHRGHSGSGTRTSPPGSSASPPTSSSNSPRL